MGGNGCVLGRTEGRGRGGRGRLWNLMAEDEGGGGGGEGEEKKEGRMGREGDCGI